MSSTFELLTMTWLKRNYLIFPTILLVSFLIAIAISTITNRLQRYPKPELASPGWWKHAVFYQIYPRSFMDSNNDGVGDLPGIIERLDHLVDIGVDAIWLSPIFVSPMVDLGYDVSDYYAIDPIFGKIEDFDNLVRMAHEKGLHVIIDFIPNHTSDEHEWFNKSADGDVKYKDYYVWKEGRNNNTEPPNNWISAFRGPTWTYHPQRNLWYLHQYASAQPDLNYRNPEVIKEIIDIMRFWLNRGIDGLRVDAAPALYEHAYFPDEEEIPSDGCSPEERCFLRTEFQRNRPQTFDVIYVLRKFVDEYSFEHGGNERVMMTESPAPLNDIVRYYGSEDGKQLGAHFSFNFWFLESLSHNSTAIDIVWVINKWLQVMDDGYVSNWLLGNHDFYRLATTFSPERSIGMIMLTMVLPGVAITYNGEEIGMENGEVTWEEGVDPKGCNASKDQFHLSRDFQRTPFHWDGTTNAGFNTGNSTWLPVSEQHLKCNVAVQKDDPKSHLSIYKKMVILRRFETFREGTTIVKELSQYVILVKRVYNRNGKLFLLNISDRSQEVNLDFDLSLPSSVKVELMSPSSKFNEGQMVPTSNIVLQAYEAVIFDYEHK